MYCITVDVRGRLVRLQQIDLMSFVSARDNHVFKLSELTVKRGGTLKGLPAAVGGHTAA